MNSSLRRTPFFIGAAAVVLMVGCVSQSSAPPLVSAVVSAPVQQAWQQGRTPEQAGSTLAPLAGRLTVTPPDQIPVDRLKLPAGFKLELWAHGLPGGRAMARADNGKIYVGTRAIGRVYEITDNGGQRTVRTVIDKLTQPAGVAVRGNTLYVFAIDKVLRFDNIANTPTVAPVDMTAAFNLPPEQHHNWKYVAFGPDGKLYVPFGAPCNICLPGEAYAQIRRYNADGSGMEVIARGVRNTVGFDWHPVTKELWFTDHGRDWMGDDTPDDELNRMNRVGLNFGFPYCHANGVPDRDIVRDNPCSGVTLPVTNMGPHAAVMGLKFYTGTMFPEDYRNAMFVARKGSWNRSKKLGFDVVAVTADADGRNAKITPFLTGFLNADETFNGRPAYIHQQPDGSLLISDEQMGAIYRVSFSR